MWAICYKTQQNVYISVCMPLNAFYWHLSVPMIALCLFNCACAVYSILYISHIYLGKGRALSYFDWIYSYPHHVLVQYLYSEMRNQSDTILQKSLRNKKCSLKGEVTNYTHIVSQSLLILVVCLA